MSQEKTKVYTYTRVSTAMQIDGYSLDAQKARMKAYADFNDYQIVDEYEDAGKLRCLGVFSVGFGCQKVKCHENKIFFRATLWPFRCNYCYCILFSI